MSSNSWCRTFSCLIVASAAVWLCLELPAVADFVESSRNSIGASIGIDIGVTHVRVAVLHDGKAAVLRNEGHELTPCYVAFTASGHRLFGHEAKSQQADNPTNTVFSVLPLMGRKFDSAAVQDHIKLMPYTVFSRHFYPSIEVQVGDRRESFRPEEIVAMLLRRMKEIAEKHLHQAVAHVVISVPSCLCYVQRMAMRDAARIAGLGDAQILNSHMATALAYYLGSDTSVRNRIVVFEVGGSSVSASVISYRNGTVKTEAYRGASCGSAGEKFEQRVTEQMMKLFQKQNGRKLAQKLQQDARAMQRIRREVERAIRFLSSSELASVEVESLLDGGDFFQVLTRSRLEELNMDLLRSALDLLDQVLDESIQDVLIVGGSSGMPWIQEHTQSLLTFSARMPSTNIDPAKSSVIGAALLGQARTSGNAMLTADVYPHSIGFMSTDDYEVRQVIASNQLIPIQKKDDLSLKDGVEAASASLVVLECELRWSSNYSIVGDASVDFPMTVAPSVLLTFSIGSSHVLTVTIQEEESGVAKTTTLDHRLSLQEMKKMSRKQQSLDDNDRYEAKRKQAMEELESLVYSISRQISKAAESKTTDLAKVERVALDVIDWLDTNDRADAEEFLMKRRQLQLAADKFKL